jgi:hypothetical protein
MPAHPIEASMSKRRTLLSPALFSIAALACLLAACKGEQPPAPAKPVATARAPAPAPVRTKEQAMAELMELPEVKAWSAQIEKASRGKAHGAIIEDDPTPRIIGGKPYWQFSFVENRPQAVHRVQSFLISQSGKDVLVEDLQSGNVQSLLEWRRTVRRVEVRAAG